MANPQRNGGESESGSVSHGGSIGVGGVDDSFVRTYNPTLSKLSIILYFPNLGFI